MKLGKIGEQKWLKKKIIILQPCNCKECNASKDKDKVYERGDTANYFLMFITHYWKKKSKKKAIVHKSTSARSNNQIN